MTNLQTVPVQITNGAGVYKRCRCWPNWPGFQSLLSGETGGQQGTTQIPLGEIFWRLLQALRRAWEACYGTRATGAHTSGRVLRGQTWGDSKCVSLCCRICWLSGAVHCQGDSV